MNTYFNKAKEKYINKKVLILGLGINQGGVGAARFFAQAEATVKVTDLKTKEELKDSLKELEEFPQIEYRLGEHQFEDIDWADIVVRNPAIKPGNQYLEYALKQKKQVEMDLSIFMNFVPKEQIIGVTGTKGKSTTSSLIYEALKSGGVDIVLAGNIGKSMLDALFQIDTRSFVVLELSSFQLQVLETKKISPKYAVITNIYPDHLNYHGSMEEYVLTKRLITKFQTEDDFLFIKKGDEETHKAEFLAGIKSKITEFSGSSLPKEYQPKLQGEHNRDNISCALEIAKVFGLDEKKTLAACKDFEGVEFRLQLIAEKNGIKIYNDTTATNPSAAIESLKSLKGAILIAGGTNKNLAFHQFAHAIDENAQKVYFLEGDATDEIKLLMKDQDKIMGTYNNLEDLVTDVLDEAKSGDTILFSPGAASFNLFQNEFDRGRQFNQAVQKLFQ